MYSQMNIAIAMESTVSYNHIINLPFPGFYGSIYSNEIDSALQCEAEYFADERQAELILVHLCVFELDKCISVCEI